MKLFILILILFISTCTNGHQIRPIADDDAPDPNVIFPMVTTPLGQLRGQLLHSRSGKPYYAYRGIPYAESPLRFQASVLKEPWEGLLDARTDGAMCSQMNSTGQVMGDEDCLYLNVFFPHHERCINETSNGKLPVYFHIHGGSFFSRSGSQFGSKYLLDECLVFVAINYRLGALGFLTTGDDIIPGNLGLKDQVTALKWAQKYITHFRGDPNAVNINGISAGAGSISHLIASPMATGLFSSAIASSGSVMNPWAIQERPFVYAHELGVKLGCSSDSDSEQLKNCLEEKTAAEIIANQANLELVYFGPTIEPKTAVNPFQTENPAAVMRAGNFNRVPIIAGFVQDEGINLSAGEMLADPESTEILDTLWTYWAPKVFLYHDLDLEEEEKNRISTEIRQFYFGDRHIGLDTRQELVDLFSDRYFVQGIFEFVETYATFAPVYAYVMTYNGGVTFATPYGYEIPVIGHGDDIQYTYHPFTEGYEELREGTEQFQFSKQIIAHWSSFARTGTPATGTVPWTPTTGNELWHQLDVEEGNFENYLEERRTFWKNLGLFEHELYN